MLLPVRLTDELGQSAAYQRLWHGERLNPYLVRLRRGESPCDEAFDSASPLKNELVLPGLEYLHWLLD